MTGRFYKIALSCFSVLVVSLLMPEISFAWGPATHLNLASAVLGNLNVLPDALHHLLKAYPHDFIYGSISADIVHGKKFIEYAKHCHNWNVGMRVLDKAESDSQKAFAYGYLSHLAADVVAHNYYVPNQIIATFPTRLLKHTYWELRFDVHADKSVWKLAKEVAKKVHEDNDPLLRANIDNTLFSFGTNKRIFNSVLMLSRLTRWHVAMDILSAKSQWRLDPHDVEDYKKLALDSTLAFLIDGKKAICCKADPAGMKSLETAHRIRKKLKELKAKGKIAPRDYPEIFENLKPHFKQATVGQFNHLDLSQFLPG